MGRFFLFVWHHVRFHNRVSLGPDILYLVMYGDNTWRREDVWRGKGKRVNERSDRRKGVGERRREGGAPSLARLKDPW